MRSCLLTHPLAASSLASWQPGLATIVANNTQPAMHRSRCFAIFQFLSSKNLFGEPSPHLGMTLKTTFSPYRLVKVSWKSVEPFPRRVVSYFVADGKRRQKTDCKTYRPTHSRHLAARMRKLSVWEVTMSIRRVDVDCQLIKHVCDDLHTTWLMAEFQTQQQQPTTFNTHSLADRLLILTDDVRATVQPRWLHTRNHIVGLQPNHRKQHSSHWRERCKPRFTLTP